MQAHRSHHPLTASPRYVPTVVVDINSSARGSCRSIHASSLLRLAQTTDGGGSMYNSAKLSGLKGGGDGMKGPPFAKGSPARRSSSCRIRAFS